MFSELYTSCPDPSQVRQSVGPDLDPHCLTPQHKNAIRSFSCTPDKDVPCIYPASAKDKRHNVACRLHADSTSIKDIIVMLKRSHHVLFQHFQDIVIHLEILLEPVKLMAQSIHVQCLLQTINGIWIAVNCFIFQSIPVACLL